MPKGKNMTDIRNIIHRLRLGQSNRVINKETKTHRTIIRVIRKLATDSDWLNPLSIMPTDEEISSKYQLTKSSSGSGLESYLPDIQKWHEEGLSKSIIHKLINDRFPCSYSTAQRFIDRKFPKKIEPVMARMTIPGEIMEVDFGYLGQYKNDTDELKKVWVFSGRLRHSRKAFRRVVLNQKTETFLHCHVLAFEYFNGVPNKIVLDNTKAAVISSTIDNEMIQRSYQELAEYYKCLISPCLPYHPQHKGGVENDIKYIKKNFLPYFKAKQNEKNISIPSIKDLASALQKWSGEIADNHNIYGVGRSPNEIFEEERKILQPLPLQRWEHTCWGQALVHKEWRVMYESAYYSVPYAFIGKTVQICATSDQIRIFLDYQEIALHMKAKKKWEYVRKAEHAPPLQEDVLQASKEGLMTQSEKIGPFTHQFSKELMSNPSIDKLRPLRLLLRLSLKYSTDRLEKACQRALIYKNIKYDSVRRILENNLDNNETGDRFESKIVPLHKTHKARFARDPRDYKTDNLDSAATKKDISDAEFINASLACLDDTYISDYGNAYLGELNGTIADQIMEDSIKKEMCEGK